MPKLKTCRMTRWKNDKFSRGAYSFLGIGCDWDDYDRLGEPVNDHVLFAGEACAREQQGTVNCAFLTGKKQAESIVKSMR